MAGKVSHHPRWVGLPQPKHTSALLAGDDRRAAHQAGSGESEARPRYRWHTFRHTYRTWLQAAGAPMPIQKELMRHASIQTTMNVYGRSLMSEAKREAKSNVLRKALRPPILGVKSERSLAAPC